MKRFKHVAIEGFISAGKTTVGKLVAQRFCLIYQSNRLTSLFVALRQTGPRHDSEKKPNAMSVCKKIPCPAVSDDATERMFWHRLSLDVTVRTRTREMPNLERWMLDIQLRA